MTLEQLVDLQNLRQVYIDKGDYISECIVTALICSTEYHDDPSSEFNTKRGISHLVAALAGLTETQL